MAEGEVKARSPAVAGALSLLVPGLGQLYNGQPALAAGLAVATYGLGLLSAFRVVAALTAPDPRPLITGVLVWVGCATLVWLGGVVLAVVAALDRPTHTLRAFNHPAVYAGAIAIFLGLGPLLLSRPLLTWMLVQNGIRSREQRSAWLARMRQAQGGAAHALAEAEARRDSIAAARMPVPDLELRLPRDSAEMLREASTVIHLVLVGGTDGGVYDLFTPEPTCVFAGGDAPAWSNSYTNPSDARGITAMHLQVQAEAGATRVFQLTVTVGNPPSSRSYVVEGMRDVDDTPPSATVERRGAGAVLRLTGSTAQRVRIEATVQCRSLKAG